MDATRRPPRHRSRSTRSAITAPLRAVVLCAAAAFAAPGEAADPAPAMTLDRAIHLLGDKDYRTRVAATDFLWRQGDAAESALLRATEHESPEVRHRARSVLHRFRWGIFPDTPKRVLDLIETYRTAAPHLRRTLVNHFLREDGPGIRALLRIGQHEADEVTRVKIYDALRRRAIQDVPRLLMEDKAEDATRLVAAAALSGADSPIRNYAAFLHQTDGLGDAIAMFHAKPKKTTTDWRILAYLHRAGGDLDAAAKAAGNLHDPDLQRFIAYERGDWKTLAEAYAEPVVDNLKHGIGVTGIEELGFASAYLRLTGRDKQADDVLQAMRDLGRANTWFIAEALMLNDRFDKAIDVFLAAGRITDAFKLHVAMGRFDKALQLVEAGDAADRRDRIALLLEAAHLWADLGERDKAQALVKPLLGHEANWDRPKTFYRYLETLLAVGLKDLAITEAGRGLSALEARGQTQAALQALVGSERAEEAVVWYSYHRQANPGQAPSDAVRQTLVTLDPKLTHEQFQTAVAGLARASGPLGQTTRARWMAGVSETWRRRGKPAMSVSYLQRAIELAPTKQRWVRLGEMLLADRRWGEAAELYDRLWDSGDHREPVWLFLNGYARVQAADGDRIETRLGQARMALARLLPLGSGERRYALIEAMDMLGLDQDALAQRRVMAATGAFDSWEVGSALTRGLLAEAIDKKQHDRVTRYTERYRLACLRTGTALLHVEHHLFLAARIADANARAALAKGDFAAATKHAKQCVSQRPQAIDLVIDVVTAADRAGKKDVGDQLFDAAYRPLMGVTAKHPASVTHSNRVAWLAAKCKRELDTALTMAKRSVARDNNNPAFLDTLAEVHFQRGDREQAIALMNKCITMQPGDDYFKQQLKRFEGG